MLLLFYTVCLLIFISVMYAGCDDLIVRLCALFYNIVCSLVFSNSSLVYRIEMIAMCFVYSVAITIYMMGLCGLCCHMSALC
jgi:hypothetical protein